MIIARAQAGPRLRFDQETLMPLGQSVVLPNLGWREQFQRTVTAAFVLLVAAAASLGGPKGGASAAPTSAPVSRDLQIYFIDVEGGQSTLFVTPAGQSLLIDTGWAGNNNRDADRIVAAAKKAGL